MENKVKNSNTKNKGIVFAITTAILFATLGIFTKYIYDYPISSNQMFFFCSFISTVVLFFALLVSKRNFSFLKINSRDFLLSFIGVGFMGLFLANILVLKSLLYIDAGIQKVITYSNPLFTIAIHFFLFHKRPNREQLISVFLMLMGLVLIVGNVNFDGESVYMGIGLSLIAALANSSYSIITERFQSNLDTNVYWFYSFLGATFFSIINLLFAKESLNFAIIFSNSKLLTLLFFSAILNFVIPYITYFWALKLLGAVRTGIALTLSPVTCVLLGVFLLKEKITALQIVGMVLVIAASVVADAKDG